ncbi:integral membrane protein [Diaporthe helianthi]|uniref:Integral membrane protein n=1 Tax=Diaporthe helianthi TaxID=158607 RepID=A0A2P5HIR3_DIAHE|nr:integral membrane protein [Diaporthe helianthi]
MENPYFNPQYQPYPQSVLIGTSVLFVIVPIVAVALRFYSRSIIGAPLAIDDWITIPAAAICVGLSVNQLIATTLGGLGTHQDLVDGQLAHTNQLLVYEKTKYTFHVLGTIGLGVIKLSVLFFYRRVFAIRAFYIVNNIFIGLTVAWTVAITFALAFQCYPIHLFWDLFESEYAEHCVNVTQLYIAVAISDMVLDILIFLLPIPHLWTLKMPLRRKLAVCGVFLTGSIVVACGITRVIIFQWVIEFMQVDPMAWVMDTTWYSSGVLFWHITENVVGLLGCCLPTYRPLVKRFLPKLMLSTRGASSGSSGPQSASLKYQARAYYRRQKEDEWPMVRGADGKARVAGSVGPGGHELEDWTKNQIFVRKEFQTETTMV